MNSLLFSPEGHDLKELRTSTAFPVGEIDVVVEVVIVVDGTEVGARQSKSLQGQPAEQFS